MKKDFKNNTHILAEYDIHSRYRCHKKNVHISIILETLW